MKQQTEFGEIPLEWQVKQVIDIKDESKRSIAMGPFGSNIKAENFVSEGVPVIRGTNMNYAKFVDGDFVYLTEDKADDLIGSNCKPNDLVFTHRGTIGQVALIPGNKFQRYVISQSGMKLTVNSQLMDSEFLFYFFKSEYGQYQILKYESQVGVPSISNPLTSLKEMAVPVPPLPEQKTIASVLSSLDDKIDLLHRQNKTLEAMAETLFRQWFIEEASDDWQESTIGDIFTIKGGGTPSTKELSYWNGGIAWTSPRDLSTAKSLYMFRTDRTITKAGLAKVSSGLLPTGTLLMSSRAPIGYLALTNIEVAINQGYIAILKHTLYSNQFMYLWCKANMELIKNSGNGSVFQEISKASFRDLPFTCPPKPLVDEFNNLVKDWFDKIKLNAKQIQTLEQLRDTLLPKLMSGDVRVMY